MEQKVIVSLDPDTQMQFLLSDLLCCGNTWFESKDKKWTPNFPI